MNQTDVFFYAYLFGLSRVPAPFRKMGSGLANAASATLECKRLCNLVLIRKCLDSTAC